MDEDKVEIQGDKTEKKDETFLKKILNKITYRIILGASIGAAIGWLYWEFIGCNGGSCPITNTSYKTILLFTLMGGFLARKK